MDSKSFTLYECNDYSVRLEYDYHIAVLHLPRVENFNKRVLKSMQNKVLDLLDFLGNLGYNGIWAGTTDDRVKRLLHLLGFNYVKDSQSISVYNVGVC